MVRSVSHDIIIFLHERSFNCHRHTVKCNISRRFNSRVQFEQIYFTYFKDYIHETT